jgi:Uncharacterised nucleotidyltransferase
MASTRPDIVDEARRVIAGAHAEDVTLRAVGGVAVELHAQAVHPALARPYQDLDLVTTRKQGRAAAKLLRDLGYEPNERFNATNGATRLVFYDLEHERQVDVFVGEFRMCHAIPIADRLHLDPDTVPLAELLLTKLQIVQLNEKDLRDIWAILYEHDVADHDDDVVNAAYVAGLLAGDWGLWRTSRQTVETARAHLDDAPLGVAERKLLDDRLERLWVRVEAEPKSLRWRGRAKVGERAQWYEQPEEVGHAAGRLPADTA